MKSEISKRHTLKFNHIQCSEKFYLLSLFNVFSWKVFNLAYFALPHNKFEATGSWKYVYKIKLSKMEQNSKSMSYWTIRALIFSYLILLFCLFQYNLICCLLVLLSKYIKVVIWFEFQTVKCFFFKTTLLNLTDFFRFYWLYFSLDKTFFCVYLRFFVCLPFLVCINRFGLPIQSYDDT
jgi:hypothetical protein